MPRGWANIAIGGAAGIGLMLLCGCPPLQLSFTTNSNTTCTSCHNGFSAIDQREFFQGAHGELSCQTCHGNGLAHIRNGGRGGLFIDNPADLAFAVSHVTCSGCHADKATSYLASPHYANRVATCIDCHDVHDRLGMRADSTKPDRLDIAGFSQICGKCHQEQDADFQLSGHAALDVATCAICHDVHDVSAFRQSPEDNSLCLQCHASTELGLGTTAAVDTHTGPMHPVDPTGSHASRCIGCHMPAWFQANQDAGPHDHTLATVPPSVSVAQIDAGLPVSPNSCAGNTGCHDPNQPGTGSPRDVNDRALNVSLQPLYDIIGTIPAKGQ